MGICIIPTCFIEERCGSIADGYKPWSAALDDGNAIMGPTFSSQDCDVLMMVGLPASVKTTWAENWVKEHPEKHYVLLGTNLALDQTKVCYSNELFFAEPNKDLFFIGEV